MMLVRRPHADDDAGVAGTNRLLLPLETLVLGAPLACLSTSAMPTPAGGLIMHSRDSHAPRH